MTTEISKGDKTRQRIIAEAAAIFNQRGYEGCSIQAIMAATGLEKGGIYRHFDSKEDLAAEAFDYAWSIASSTDCNMREGSWPRTSYVTAYALRLARCSRKPIAPSEAITMNAPRAAGT